eukprot:333489_1
MDGFFFFFFILSIYIRVASMFLFHVLLVMYLRSDTIINAQTAPDNNTQYVRLNEKYNLALENDYIHFIFNNTITRNILFEMHGGTGDGDLYVKYDEKASEENYDCRPWEWGNNETCSFVSAPVGLYYIMIHAFSSFADVEFTVTDFVYNISDDPQYVEMNESYTMLEIQSNLDGNVSASMEFIFNNTIIRNIVIQMKEKHYTNGDAHLYVRYGVKPSYAGLEIVEYDCGPPYYLVNYPPRVNYGSYAWRPNNETCIFESAEIGQYYIMIAAYENFYDVELTVTDYTLEPLFVEMNDRYTMLAATYSKLGFIFNNTKIRNIVIEINNGTGNADLYVRYGAKPSSIFDDVEIVDYDCGPFEFEKPYRISMNDNVNDEACYFDSAAIGEYYIMIVADNIFSGVSLTVTEPGIRGPNCFVESDNLYVCECEGDACVSYIFPQPTQDIDFKLVCNNTDECKMSTIYCPTGANCNIICDSKQSCQYSNIHCPINGNCNIICDGEYSCAYSNIHCPMNGNCNIICTGSDYQYPCHYATINSTLNALVTVNCSHFVSCEYLNLIASPNKDFIQTCGVAISCTFMNIECPVNANCDIICLSMWSCHGVKIKCPLYGNCNVVCSGRDTCLNMEVEWSPHLLAQSTLFCNRSMHGCQGMSSVLPEIHNYIFNGSYDLGFPQRMLNESLLNEIIYITKEFDITFEMRLNEISNHSKTAFSQIFSIENNEIVLFSIFMNYDTIKCIFFDNSIIHIPRQDNIIQFDGGYHKINMNFANDGTILFQIDNIIYFEGYQYVSYLSTIKNDMSYSIYIGDENNVPNFIDGVITNIEIQIDRNLFFQTSTTQTCFDTKGNGKRFRSYIPQTTSSFPKIAYWKDILYIADGGTLFLTLQNVAPLLTIPIHYGNNGNGFQTQQINVDWEQPTWKDEEHNKLPITWKSGSTQIHDIWYGILRVPGRTRYGTLHFTGVLFAMNISVKPIQTVFWESIPVLNRIRHFDIQWTACLTNNGTHIFMQYLTNISLYNIDKHEWHESDQHLKAALLGSACDMYKGKMYIYGGYININEPGPDALPRQIAYKTIYEYDADLDNLVVLNTSLYTGLMLSEIIHIDNFVYIFGYGNDTYPYFHIFSYLNHSISLIATPENFRTSGSGY